MNPEQIKAIVDSSMNQMIWWFLGAAIAIWIKNLLENAVSALVFIMSRDYTVDDEVLIGGTRRARIVRQTFSQTVFYMYDNNTRLIIPNREFSSLRCEKVLTTSQER